MKIDEVIIGSECIYAVTQSWSIVDCGVIVNVNENLGLISIYNKEKDELIKIRAGWVKQLVEDNKYILCNEKESAKRMEYIPEDNDYKCPNCKSRYDNPQNDGILYCAICGQKIDWSEEE